MDKFIRDQEQKLKTRYIEAKDAEETIAEAKTQQEEQKQRFDDLYEETKKKYKTAVEGVQKAENDRDQEFRDLFKKIHTALKDLSTKNQEKLYNLEKEKKESLESIEVAIIEAHKTKLSVSDSIDYWKEKSGNHQKAIQKMWKITTMLAILALALFIGASLFLFGGTPKEPMLWKYGIMLAISSLSIWAIRLTSKIFISNLHLRMDADERVTMLKTYIALQAQDRIPPGEDSQLILQTLFRPGSTGFIKEEGPVGIGETLPKTLMKLKK